MPAQRATDSHPAAGTRELSEASRRSALLKTGALQSVILNSANFPIIATDEKAVIQTEQQLNEAVAAAEKANLAKSDFLSSMSHELRTPLNAMKVLRSDPATAHIPTIALSANAVPRDTQRSPHAVSGRAAGPQLDNRGEAQLPRQWHAHV